ncbi:hypothetical protein KCU93_g10447, partial [Aureobasidium melanogenum]
MLGRTSRAGRSSGARNFSKAPLHIDDGDDSKDGTPLKKKTTASGSKPPVVLEIHRTSRPLVEVSPPVSKPSGSLGKKLGRLRTTLKLAQNDEEEISTDTPAPAKRSVGRLRKSFPEAVRQARDQDRDNEDSSGLQCRIEDEAGPSAVHQRPARPKVSNSPRPPRTTSKKALAMNRSSNGPMRSRGRPRKTSVAVARSSVTSAATSRNEEIGTTGVDESDAYDPAAAQAHDEVQSARQTLPRRPSSEFDKAFSEFRSSQILRGTQPEPARPAEQVTVVKNVEEGEEGEDSEIMVDAAAASSLSQKDLPYELETTSYSILDSNDSSTGLAINSSSGVYTLLVPLARRYSADAIVLDSQSYNATKADADYRSGGY